MLVRVVQKGGKGKGKKEAKGEEGVELTDAQKVEKANLRIEALERELGVFCPLNFSGFERKRIAIHHHASHLPAIDALLGDNTVVGMAMQSAMSIVLKPESFWVSHLC
jgi:hypothetical protein